MARNDLALEVVVQQTYDLTKGLADAAFRSELTGLYNRQALSRLAAAHDRGDTPRFAVVYADLTGFKAINETHGHDGGDAVLKKFGRLFEETCQEVAGYAYHLSGDEFVGLLPPERVNDFRTAAKKVHQFSLIFLGKTVEARAHFGIAEPDEDSVINVLQGRAEKACSTAKTSQMEEPLVWTAEDQEKPPINKRWRCEHCQATVHILVPVERRSALPFHCINCHQPLPG